MAGRDVRDLAEVAICFAVSGSRCLVSNPIPLRMSRLRLAHSDVLAILMAYVYLPEVSSRLLPQGDQPLTPLVDSENTVKGSTERKGPVEERDHANVQGSHVRLSRSCVLS